MFAYQQPTLETVNPDIESPCFLNWLGAPLLHVVVYRERLRMENKQKTFQASRRRCQR